MKHVLIVCARRIVLLWLLVAGCAHATVVYTVGFSYDVACDFSDLRSALTAAAANPNGPIEIRDSNTPDNSLSDSYTNPYGSVGLYNPQSDITVIGGYSDCSAADPTPNQRTRLVFKTPSHDADYPLLSMSNDNANPRRSLTLRNMVLQGANDPSLTTASSDAGTNTGHAIVILNNYQLTLDNSRINGFSSGGGATDPFGHGGAVFVYSSGTDPSRYPELTLLNGSDIYNNTATYGGGVYVDHGRLNLDASSIDNNRAWRDGGGIWLNDESDTGSAASPTNVALSLGNGSFVTYNAAGASQPFTTSSGLGGGIYSHYGQIRMQGHPVNTPLFESYVQNNTANEGGGIYVEGPDQASGGPFTFVRVLDAQLTGNVSNDRGGAIYSLNAVDWRFDNSGGPCDSFFLGAVACSYLGNNQAQGQASSSPVANGGAAYLTNDRVDGASRGIVRFLRTQFVSNSDPNGLAAIAATGGTSEMVFNRDIFTANSADTGSSLDVPSVLVYSDNGNSVDFRYNTVLDNTVTRMFTMVGGTLNAQGSILWGSASAKTADYYIGFFSGGADFFDNACALLRDTTYLPTVSNDWIGDAPQLGDLFAPGGGSPAIDNCDSSHYLPPADIYGHGVYDVPGVPPRWTTTAPYNFDLGAVEQTDIIYANGFGNRPDN